MPKPFLAERSPRNRSFVRYMCLAFVGLLIPAGLGIYNRKVDGGEGYHKFYTFPARNARPLYLSYGDDGILHKLISPHSMDGTFSLTNDGDDVKIRMQMTGVPEGLTVHWGSGHTRDFNLDTATVERVLHSGDSVSVHHTYHVGENLRQQPVIFDGGLVVSDADSGETLLTIPIRIQRAGLSPRPYREEGGHVH
jgi:hypothetical protein